MSASPESHLFDAMEEARNSDVQYDWTTLQRMNGQLDHAPSINQVLEYLEEVPPEFIFFGIDSGREPFYLDATDTAEASPILVVSQKDGGKTHFLQVVTAMADHMHVPGSIRITVITNRPEAWDSVLSKSAYNSVIDISDDQALHALEDIQDRWEQDISTQFELVVVDEYGNLMEDTQDNDALKYMQSRLFTWPERRIWPIVSVDCDDIGQIPQKVLKRFKTRFFGLIENREIISNLGLQDVDPQSIIPNIEYVMQENGDFVSLWIPSLNEEN